MSWYVRVKTVKSNVCRPAESEKTVWTASGFDPELKYIF